VESALSSRDFVFDISGAAGVGKTTLLKDLKRGLAEARVSTMAVGPSRTSVEQLQKDGFGDAVTIAELLVSPQKQAALSGQVLIVDEAGMVGSKDMDQLLGLAKKHGVRVLTVGDTKQIKAVDAGDALRILQRHSEIHSANVTEIVRQRDPEVRAALQALRTNPARGYELLDKLGCFREVHWRERSQEIAKEYLLARATINPEGKVSSTQVIAGTHEEIKNITHAIRTELKKLGELSDGENVTRLVDLTWTEAQKRQLSFYKPGQVVTFHAAVAGLAKKNESLEVVTSNKKSLTARRDNGKTVKLSAEHGKKFGVFEKDGMEISQGNKILLQANWKDKTFRATNGELVTVANCTHGKIRLEDGRELPSGYKQFTSGYAVTPHTTQAKTVEIPIVSLDGMPIDQAYVALTRGREKPRGISSDLLGVQEAIGVPADRQSAIELAQLRAQLQSYESQMTTPEISRKPVQPERQIETEKYVQSISY
jgi:ATP-dependent exoDNAse (exonuclease V) alpha subunit